MKTPPSRLYKYERLDAQTLRNLKAQVLYFGSPRGFNDPYDCACTPNIKTPQPVEVEELRKEYLSRPDLSDRQRQDFTSLPTIELAQTLVRVARNALQQETETFLNERGVTCFSETNDDLLMWSHYGGRYKGFCLEFDSTIEPLTKARKVRYLPALPELDVSSILIHRDFDPVLHLYCTKSDSWSYEREWRALHNKGGTEFGYRAEALTGVYFGPVNRPAFRGGWLG